MSCSLGNGWGTCLEHFAPPTSHFQPRTSNLALPTSYFQLRTSSFVLRKQVNCFLIPLFVAGEILW